MKWAYSSVYLSQTMWNPTKNSMKRLKRPTSVFYNGTLGALGWKRQKNTKTRETKTQITQNFEQVWPIEGGTICKRNLRKWNSADNLNFPQKGCFIYVQSLQEIVNKSIKHTIFSIKMPNWHQIPANFMIHTLLSRNFAVRVYALFRRFFETEEQKPQILHF